MSWPHVIEKPLLHDFDQLTIVTTKGLKHIYVLECESIGFLPLSIREGITWARGWDGPAVDALRVTVALS